MKNKTISIVVILALLIGVVAFIGVSQDFTFTNGRVYLPNYVSIWCDRLPQQITGTYNINDKGSITCGYKNTDSDDGYSIDAYVPYTCSFFPQKNIQYKIVNGNEQCSFSLFSAGTTARNGDTVKVNNLQKLCINEGAIGTTGIKYDATPYGLRINSANGKVIFTKNCDLKSNINNVANIDYIPGFSDTPRIIEPSSSVNHYINGYSEVVNDKDVVNFRDARIYIYAVGKYYPIEKSADDYDFANSLKPRSDSDLICVPSQNPLCEGGTVIKVEDKSCSGFDRPEDFVAIGGNEECTFKCVNNVLVKDVCRDIAICPADKPYRNPVTNICERSGSDIPQEDLNCAWYQDQYIKDVKVWKWYNVATFGLISPEIQPTSGCKTSGWVYMLIIGLVVISLGAYALYTQTGKGRKRKRK